MTSWSRSPCWLLLTVNKQILLCWRADVWGITSWRSSWWKRTWGVLCESGWKWDAGSLVSDLCEGEWLCEVFVVAQCLVDLDLLLNSHMNLCWAMKFWADKVSCRVVNGVSSYQISQIRFGVFATFSSVWSGFPRYPATRMGRSDKLFASSVRTAGCK